jgi:hypothetical protein
MPTIQEAAQQVNAAIDHLAQTATGNPQQLQPAVHDAKQKVAELVRQAQQAAQQAQAQTQKS